MQKLMTAQEVAEFLLVKRKFVYTLIKRGELKCYRIGNAHDIRVSDEQLRDYLKSREYRNGQS